MNSSKRKGNEGEREVVAEFHNAGLTRAFRSRQFMGSPFSPDIVVPEIEVLHVEAKRQERCSTWDVGTWVEQATRDAGETKLPIVVHRRSHKPWLCSMALAHVIIILDCADIEKLNRAIAK